MQIQSQTKNRSNASSPGLRKVVGRVVLAALVNEGPRRRRTRGQSVAETRPAQASNLRHGYM